MRTHHDVVSKGVTQNGGRGSKMILSMQCAYTVFTCTYVQYINNKSGTGNCYFFLSMPKIFDPDCRIVDLYFIIRVLGDDAPRVYTDK
jgi:hypothetical protein